MSRLYTRNSRGRQPILTGPRTKEYADQTYQEPRSRRHRASGKYSATVQQSKVRRTSSTATDSSSGDMDGEDASDEESQSDEDDDEPAVLAPSRKTFVHGTGRFTPAHEFDTASLAGSVDSMFGGYDGLYGQFEDPDLSPDENLKRFESNVFAASDDDDEVYRAVDEISDSDDDDAEQYEEQQLMAALSDDDDDVQDEEFYLNQIDGFSAYGFGDESDATVQLPPSSHGSDGGVPTEHMPERHVRFDMESHYQLMSSSPTISRALLPSALPEKGKVFGGPASAAMEPFDESTTEDEYDSDATDDDLPDEALQTRPMPKAEEVESMPSPSPSASPISKPKSAIQRKGPPRGVFIDEGDKASGILDRSGKIMLITYPHLLGEAFARKYGDSASNSPSIGFQELIDEKQAGDSNQSGITTPAAGTDIMLASLNSQLDPANLGQAFGPQEAFYPALGFQAGDYAFDADDFDGDFDGDLGEDIINMDDVIKFDDDSNDSDDQTSPIFMPPKKNLSLGNASDFEHLTNGNVTAFRNNADPSFAAYSNTTSFIDFPDITTPARSRKRRANDSPYTSSHYNGVTPVQRMKDPNPPSTPDSTIRPKRRRLMTA